MNKLAETLKNLGVSEIYFCSGSRNYSLKSLLRDQFKLHFHFDERVSAFMALGAAKMSQKPVVVCTTSGTAVAECLPAMVEAYYSNVKLIMLSSDRPNRLRFSFAPQAINQDKIFQNFTRSYFSGTLAEFTEIKNDFPMHINLEIDDAHKDIAFEESRFLAKGELTQLFNQANAPLILFTEDDRDNSDLFEIFSKTGCYLFKECTSNIRLNSQFEIKYDHTLVKMLKSNAFDLIIKFGRTPISKVWRLLDNTFTHIPVISVGPYPTALSRGSILSCGEELMMESFSHKKVGTFLEKDISQQFSSFPNSEIALYAKIINSIAEDSIVMLGNSMAIRYGQLLYKNEHTYMAMRGANGIDGQISTALGIASQTTKKVHLIIGDLTFLYDLSALLIEFPAHFYLHVVDNRGGRIFERIGLHDEVINEHSYHLEKITSGFSKKQITFYFPDNEQTQKHWESIV